MSAALTLGSQPRGSTAEELNLLGLAAARGNLARPLGHRPHLRQDEHDLFFAQGFNVARDRLFQLEMWRRLATGTLQRSRGRARSTAILGLGS